MNAASVLDFIARRGRSVTVTSALSGGRTAEPKAATRYYKPDEISGNVQQGDREVRVAAAGIGFTPRRSDEVVIDGRTHTIESVETVYLGEEPVLHVIQARG